MKEFTYTTKGTCSMAIEGTVDDNSIMTVAVETHRALLHLLKV